MINKIKEFYNSERFDNFTSILAISTIVWSFFIPGQEGINVSFLGLVLLLVGKLNILYKRLKQNTIAISKTAEIFLEFLRAVREIEEHEKEKEKERKEEHEKEKEKERRKRIIQTKALW